MNESLLALVTALADDELILGHRHSEWTGHAPHIEEDVAFSSIAQDEIGHAAAYYSLVADDVGDSADRLALGRSKDEYRHAVLCERPNGDWAYTLARHWLYDHADALRLEALENSADHRLAAVATKLRREERYHLIHADMWLRRVSHGPAEGRARLIESITKALPEAMALFEPFELEDEAVKEGWLPVGSEDLRARFVAETTEALDDTGVPTKVTAAADQAAEFIASSAGDLIEADESTRETSPGAGAFGGRRGRHSPDFDELWDVMTLTYRENPGATW